jgi:hypothetical protein
VLEAGEKGRADRGRVDQEEGCDATGMR